MTDLPSRPLSSYRYTYTVSLDKGGDWASDSGSEATISTNVPQLEALPPSYRDTQFEFVLSRLHSKEGLLLPPDSRCSVSASCFLYTE